MRYNQGQAVIVVAVFLITISTAIISGFVGPVVREAKTTTELADSKQGYFLSEAGVEDVVYRLRSNQAVSTVEELDLNGSRATTTTSDVLGTKEIVANSSISQIFRKIKTVLTVTSGASFSLGLQAGQGGVDTNNNFTLIGSLYSNGPVTAANNVEITGDLVSAGPDGLIEDASVGGNAYAHTIKNSDIDGDAYYVTKTGTSVGGTSYPNSPDQPIVPLPISDEMIEVWESQAEAGGVTNCSGTYTISTNSTIGPRKYTCNVTIEAESVTLTGPIWVVGDFIINNGTDISISPSQSGKSIPVIADNPNNRTSSSRIIINNNANFHGSGTNSYITLISQNNSAETGGSTSALEVHNNAEGDYFLYAGHGYIVINNNADFNQVTAYKIRVNNNVTITYETGMANLTFSAGPGGAWNINDWLETQ